MSAISIGAQQSRIWFEPTKTRWIFAEQLRRLSRVMPGDSLLVCGDSTGHLSAALEAHMNTENTIDVADPSDWSSPAECYQCVIGLIPAGQIPIPALVQSCWRALRPGGRLILVCEPSPSLGRPADAGFPEIRNALRETGFDNLQTIPFRGGRWTVFGSLAFLVPAAHVLGEQLPSRSDDNSCFVCGTKPDLASHTDGSRPGEYPELWKGVSVVIPCHNEEATIADLVRGVFRYFGDLIHEVVPVDDNSSDSTRDVLAALAQENPRVRPVYRTGPNGVGRALADGLRAATGKWVLTMDADFLDLLPELRAMFRAAAEGCPAVIGSRFHVGTILAGYPYLKLVANRCFHMLLRLLLLNPGVRDVTNNLKLFRRDVLDCLKLRESGFGANAETGCLPWLAGYECREVPISWINRSENMGTSSFRLLSVGHGYARVLGRLLLARYLRCGAYRSIVRRSSSAQPTGPVAAVDAALAQTS